MPELTDDGIYRLGLILAIQAEIEGMKVENAQCVSNGYTPPYGFEHFQEKQQEIENATHSHIEQLQGSPYAR